MHEILTVSNWVCADILIYIVCGCHALGGCLVSAIMLQLIKLQPKLKLTDNDMSLYSKSTSHPRPCPSTEPVPPRRGGARSCARLASQIQTSWRHLAALQPLSTLDSTDVLTWGCPAEAGRAALGRSLVMARQRRLAVALCLLITASLAQGQIFGTQPPTGTPSPTLAPTATPSSTRAPASAAPPPPPAAASASPAASPAAPPAVRLMPFPTVRPPRHAHLRPRLRGNTLAPCWVRAAFPFPRPALSRDTGHASGRPGVMLLEEARCVIANSAVCDLPLWCARRPQQARRQAPSLAAWWVVRRCWRCWPQQHTSCCGGAAPRRRALACPPLHLPRAGAMARPRLGQGPRTRTARLPGRSVRCCRCGAFVSSAVSGCCHALCRKTAWGHRPRS